MNSTISTSRLLVSALCGVLLAGCDSIKSVPEEPSAILPTPTVVLEGTVTNLSSLRSVTLTNNGNGDASRSFLAAFPNVPNTGPAVVPFSFGSVPQGSAYKIEVKPGTQPYGKNCVVNNGEGVITTATALNIQVVCTNNVTRYSVTVTLPAATPGSFTTRPNAKVRLTTEEQIYEQTVTPGQATVVFPSAVFSAAVSTGELNRFNYYVTASITDQEVLSRCLVTAGSGVDPVANVTAPVVGTCDFTVGGNIAYSQPPGVAFVPGTLISGLELQLRDVQGNVKETLVVPNCTPATSATTCAYTFASLSRSNASAVYDVAVSRHANGQHCVVANGSAANLFVLPPSPTIAPGNPASVANANVRCRALPTAQKQLTGIYRLERTVYTPVAPAAVVTSDWTAFDTTRHNTGSGNMLSFFNDGTFLYGTHAGSNQVEHGFYDFDPVAGKIRFSLITDTNASTTFPTNFDARFLAFPVPPPPAPANSLASVLTTTPGISAVPGQSLVDTVAVRSLAGVTFGTDAVTGLGTVRTISGTFGTDTAAPFTAATTRVGWTLVEPVSVSNEMTGTWISQDHRRFFVWDYRNYFGTHVGVLGGAANMNDACFTLEDVHVPEGIYTRRGTLSRCLPFSQHAAANTAYTLGFGESIDFSFPAAANVPGFIGRLPGGQGAADGRSPSPIRFKIASASSFPTDATYFTAPAQPFTSWCTTEILAIRNTLNDSPIDYPVYLCRVRGAAPTP